MIRAVLNILAVVSAGLVVTACSSCQPSPSPGPTPPPPPPAAAVRVYSELVEAGYMAGGDPTGPSSLQEEFTADYCPPWLACLYDGGTPLGCKVPRE